MFQNDVATHESGIHTDFRATDGRGTLESAGAVNDLTRFQRPIRTLDVTSTLRSFVAPILLFEAIRALAAAITLGLPFIRTTWQGPQLDYFGFITFFFLVLGPFLLVIVDWFARQPYRFLSGLLYLIGWILVLLFIVLMLAMTVLTAGLGPLSQLLTVLVATFGTAFGWVAYLFNLVGLGGLWPLGLAVAVVISLYLIAIVAFTAFLPFRQIAVEGHLKKKANPRHVLLSRFIDPSVLDRFLYTFGLPTSAWADYKGRKLSFWLMLLSRPLLYAGYLVVINLPGTVLASGIVDGLFYGDLPGERQFRYSPGTHAVFSHSMWALAVVGAAYAMFTVGKRRAVRSTWTHAQANDIGPILYLRSFKDDQTRMGRPWHDFIGNFIDHWGHRRNLDEILVSEFESYAPVVALGRVDEKNQPFGAAREYVREGSDADWQTVITEVAQQASAIILVAGDSEGLAWEYELINRENLMNKTLIVFPPHRRVKSLNAMLSKLADRIAAIPADFKYLPKKSSPVALRVSDNGVETFIVNGKPESEAYIGSLRVFFYDRFTDIYPDIRGPWSKHMGKVAVAGLIGLLGLVILGIMQRWNEISLLFQ